MKKTVFEAFGKRQYLLGRDKDGTLYWLREALFYNDSYWGMGYINTFTNNERPDLSDDIKSIQCFDGLFMHKMINMHDRMELFFEEMTLSGKELWTLCELMESLYAVKEYSDMIRNGGDHYGINPCREVMKNAKEYERINKIVIPKILSEIYKLLLE